MTTPKTVLITGASRGIGLLCVKTLALSGFYVIASMRDMKGKNASIVDELTTWAAGKQVSVECIELDVTSDTSVIEAVSQIQSQRQIDVVINNAGIMPVGVTEAFTPEDIQKTMDVNVVGVARVCRAVLPAMRERNQGLLVNVSSNAGRLAIPFFGVYCASKWALEAYCESLHHELTPFNIESVLVEPGGHGTDLIETPPEPSDKDVLLTYGDVAKGPENAKNMFKDVFAQQSPDTDAQNVADKILTLIQTKGPKPMRTLVGNSMGVDKINQLTAPIQSEFIRIFMPIAQVQAKDGRFVAYANIEPKPEYYQQAKAAVEAIIPATLAEAGCHVFTLMESTDGSGRLHIFEVFEDKAALAFHYEQGYTKEVFENYQTWLAKPVEIIEMTPSSLVTSEQLGR